MFFAVIPLATSFVIERSQGSLLRLRVLGVSATTLMLSKALPYYFVNLLQMLVMFAVGIWLVPALGGDRLDPGHSIVGLWLIGSATSLAAIGLALRSEEHTSELQSLMRLSYAVFCLIKK